MIFVAPLALVALVALPLLWWLLRVTPPAPRREIFPAISLLLGLHPTEETPARTPWWLLLLRLVAAALVILALARPVLDSAGSMAGSGPVLLVIDNGWAAAADWPRRMQMANTVLDRAARAGRSVALLATAAGETGAAPKATAPMPVTDLRSQLGALRPEPWPSDRAAAVPRDWTYPGTDVVYIADGLQDGSDFPAFDQRLSALGKVSEFCCLIPPKLLLPPLIEADRMAVRVARASGDKPDTAVVLAQEGDGRTMARADVHLAADETAGQALAVKLGRLAAALHGQGFVHRDFYACHVFVDKEHEKDASSTGGRDARPTRARDVRDMASAGGMSATLELYLIDLARVFRPRWRQFRWRVKDLAQLKYSMPVNWVNEHWGHLLDGYLDALAEHCRKQRGSGTRPATRGRDAMNADRLSHAIDHKLAEMVRRAARRRAIAGQPTAQGGRSA